METLPYEGFKIRNLRQRAGLSLAQLGERTGSHPESLRNLEKNRKKASVVMLARIANALGVALDDLLVDEPTEPQRRSA